jgi:hypothetical protein
MALIDKFTIHEKAEQSIGSIKRLLCLITCVDMKLLERCPEAEKKKYTSLGVAMLITTLLSFFSAFIAIDYIFPEIEGFGFSTLARYSLATFLSLIWMSIIFNLQRFVLSGDSRTSDSDRAGFDELIRALPSIVMAIMIGMVVAIPLEVAIFKPEIDIYLKIEQERKFLANANVIEERSLPYRQQACTEFYRYQQTQELPLIRCLPRSNGEIVMLQSTSPGNHEESAPSSEENATPSAEFDAVAAAGQIPDAVDAPAQVTVPREPEPESIQETLDNIAKLAQLDSNESMRQEEINKLGGGLVFRAAALFEHIPFFAYVVMLIVVFVQLTPVLIKMMAAKSPYDYLQDMQNRLVAAVGRAADDDEVYHFDRSYGGIEINAVAVYDSFGEGKPVTLYHGADEITVIKLAQFAAENRELEQRRLADMNRRYSKLKKLAAIS